MQVTINSDNTATIKVDRSELAVIDYSLGYYAGQMSGSNAESDIELANKLEQQLWTEYCRLVDQIQERGQYEQEQYEALWAN